MLHTVAVLSLLLACVSALWVAGDIVCGHRQKMWIMDLVWPVTCLYSGPLGLWAYYKVGRRSTKQALQERGTSEPKQALTSALGSTHCGAGCTLGDLVAESFLFFFPWMLWGHKIFGAWVVDYLLAFGFGIAFQYFTIAPMRGLSLRDGIVAALKADSLSLTSWQLGMYGWMAVVTFGIFGHELRQDDPVFWFMMQIAMLFGFATSYPVNWWLIRHGLKEKMKMAPPEEGQAGAYQLQPSGSGRS